ncbi:MAG: UbiA family prenyltransferase, partial [Sciscionella sp.]
LAVHLSMVTGRWLILALVLVGVLLGLGYSLGPIHLKGRGLGHLACLWLLLFFLPMVCAALLVADPSVAVLLVAAAYATVEMGIILVNTSEDLLEDRAARIRTTTVALGLTGTLGLASTMVGIGGAGFCAFWVVTYAERGVPPLGYLTAAVFAVVCVVVFARMVWLTRRVSARKNDEEAAVSLVKAHGPLVPIAATLVGWVGVLCAVTALTAWGA